MYKGNLQRQGAILEQELRLFNAAINLKTDPFALTIHMNGGKDLASFIHQTLISLTVRFLSSSLTSFLI